MTTASTCRTPFACYIHIQQQISTRITKHPTPVAPHSVISRKKIIEHSFTQFSPLVLSTEFLRLNLQLPHPNKVGIANTITCQRSIVILLSAQRGWAVIYPVIYLSASRCLHDNINQADAIFRGK